MAASHDRCNTQRSLSIVNPDETDEAAVISSRHLLPVTTLESHRCPSKAFLFAGSGTAVQALDLESGRICGALQVFRAQAVHGITHWTALGSHMEKQSTIYLVWGGRSLRVLGTSKVQVDLKVAIEKLSEEILVDDWILDVYCLPPIELRHGSASQALILSAHNIAYLLSFQCHSPGNPIGYTSIVKVAVGPSSMLYSADMASVDGHNILVASGTVFGEILLWTFCLPSTSNPADLKTGHLLQNYHGHEGSVFGVKLLESPGVNPSHTSFRTLMASCSDDRTIRVWNYSNEITDSRKSSLGNGDDLPRQTGFGSERDQGCNQNRCVGAAMGHASRIWSLGFLSNSTSLLRLLTFGEDGTTQLWRITDDFSPKRGNDCELILQHEATKAYHNGKNIWAKTLINVQDTPEPKVVTGGADGRVVLFDVDAQWLQTLDNIHITLAQHLSRINSKAASLVLDDGKSQSPTRSLFQDMNGEWKLLRTIKSKLPTYPSGIFRGTAKITPKATSNKAYSLEYLYEEEGSFTTEQGLSLRGSRRYVYRYQQETDTISAWFVKPESESIVDYLFHEVSFEPNDGHENGFSRSKEKAVVAQGHHLCIEDNYDAKYEFKSTNGKLDKWSIMYQVVGPKKDYTLIASYTQRSEVSISQSADAQVSSSYFENKELQTKDSSTMQIGASSNIKAYCWLNGNQLLVTTDAGQVAIGSFEQEKRTDSVSGLLMTGLVWNYITLSSDLASHSMIFSSEDLDGALLTGKSGIIYYVNDQGRSLDEMIRLPSKVINVFVENLQNSFDPLRSSRLPYFVGVVATCIGLRSALVFQLGFETQDRTGHLTASAAKSLTLPASTLITSACWLYGKLGSETLVLGSRSGALFIFADLQSSESQDQTPLMCVHRLHIEDSITVIQSLPTDEDYAQFLLTAGRDSRYAVHHLLYREHENVVKLMGLRTVHEGEPPFGPNIEGAMFDEQTRDLILWGFKGRHFVVWNESREREVMEIDCGGAHRSWAYHRQRNSSEGGKLVWTKASAFHLRIHPRPSHRVLRGGTHGREIKAIAICPRYPTANARFLMATGAEDTTIRLAMYDHSTNKRLEPFEYTRVIKKHRTGIQQLRWSLSGQYLFSAGGYEELYVWRLQHIPGMGIGITQKCRCPPVTTACDLRVTDFDIFVEVEGTDGDEESFIVGAVYSDSSVRIWRCTTRGTVGNFELLFSGIYTTCCLTQVSIILSRSVLITAGTDGHVALWSIPLNFAVQHASQTVETARAPAPAPLGVVGRHKVHQNTIKSMAILSSSPDIILVTGGDDNALAFTRVETVRGEPPRYSFSTLLVPSAHASAINAVQGLNENNSFDDRGQIPERSDFSLITAGNDQKVKRWSLRVEPNKPGVEGFHVKRVSNQPSSVADASCMALVSSHSGNAVAVAGVGMEVWGI